VPGPPGLHRYDFDPRAEEEFVEALRLYEREAGSGVADSFEEEVRRSIDLILRYPRISPAVGLSDVRCKILRGFPYNLFYVVERDLIWILAVAHQSRLPGYWGGRL
jgi:plasmid stabilization system protein ParE